MEPGGTISEKMAHQVL